MKKFIYTLAMILGVGFLSTSCSDDYLDDLTGKYTTPEAKTFTTASYTRTLEGTNFHFKVALSNGSETLNIEFVDDKYYLTESTFYNHTAAGSAKGHFVKETTNFNGTACANENGMVFIKKAGDDYKIDGNVWLTDGRIIHATWEGKLTFEEYIPDFGYTCTLASAPLMVDGAAVDGAVDNTVQVFNGGTLVANLQFATAEGASIVGNYTISSTYNAAGLANNGYDFRGYGWPVFGGTYVVTSAGTENFLTTGVVEISEKDGAYRIIVAGQDLGICHAK